MAVIFQVVSIAGMTADVETWSGRVTIATFHPRWVEEYQQMHTRTVGSGKDSHTEIYYTTEHRTHSQYWDCGVNYGKNSTTYRTPKSLYDDIVKKFGGKIVTKRVYKSGFDSGDHNIYVTKSATGYIYPACKTVTFENRVKAAPSLFSFAKVPEKVRVHPYPANKNWNSSNRLLGPTGINITKWDQMNARLGPTKKVNVILINFVNKDRQAALYQESAWVGGKKNDLVLCKGEDWSYVFGWTEKEISKRNLETILLENELGDELIPKIEEEIKKNYVIKDWDKFSYISIDPPFWSYIVFIFVLAGAQTGFWIWANKNQMDKRWKMKD